MINFVGTTFDSKAVAYKATEEFANKIDFLGKAFFPDNKKFGLDLKWIKSHKGLSPMLQPASFDTIPKLRVREGAISTTTEMAFFRETMQIKEQDMMNMLIAKDSNDPLAVEALNDIYDDANNLIMSAEVVAEVMRMQLLATNAGTPEITIGASDGVTYRYNYDIDGTYASNHYLPLSGTATWDNASTAKPFNDLKTATNYLKDNGYDPAYLLMNSKTWGYLLESAQLKNAIISVTGRVSDFVDTATASSVFKRMTNLEPLIYDKTYKNYAGAPTKFYPDDQVTIISAGNCGKTHYGVTPEERTLLSNPAADVSLYNNAVAVAVVEHAGPPVSVTTTVSQICLPSYEGMDGTFVIKVK